MATQRPVRIANFSGAMGDRFDAFEQAIHGEPVDVVFGDYMTEAFDSMLIAAFLSRSQNWENFYAELFMQQLLPQLEAVARKGIKVVTNAGVFNPRGMARAIRAAVAQRGLGLKVAYITGDDLREEAAGLLARGQLVNMDTGAPLACHARGLLALNAYLGGWGIKAALDEGADIVITGRVADASLVTGPAAWWHGWRRIDLDKIAGAMAAGHVLECGPQATGGNFSGFTRIEDNILPGFPIAEIAQDGSSVITKQAAQGGAVTVDTVTAQLLYEIQGPLYLNADVTWHTNSVSLTQEGPDRVRITGARGSAPSTTTKVNIDFQDGYRSAVWIFPTGLQIEEKVAILKAQASRAARDHQIDALKVFVCGQPVEDPRDQWQATVPVQIVVAAPSKETVSQFIAQLTSYWLGSFPGFYTEITRVYTDAPQPRIDYRAALVRQDALKHQVHLPDGRVLHIAPPPGAQPFTGQPAVPATPPAEPGAFGPTVHRPLGEVAYARVGDKGAHANLGVWVSDPTAYPWLASYLTVAELRRLLGIEGVDVERYEQPLLHGISFVLKGYFSPSGSANLDLDQIGKSLGEFLRARHVDIPASLLTPAH
ncbi:acyclic terpene utilization AtuA family protein [Streptomyces sp. ISL-11]|uniref:acyclic terpene utilization AtuA family protein n=1 Tax=Streptomyces sp. ISL-11 TaxID=2819174 RepID=UPI001BE52855|nr:acyclic terpene utilization AtuA family protein [Streptomyces sp. ISL-11]MBT2385293.1 DUF1446 domain-containing protein [Streptomyces sp. ISL-11]